IQSQVEGTLLPTLHCHIRRKLTRMCRRIPPGSVSAISCFLLSDSNPTHASVTPNSLLPKTFVLRIKFHLWGSRLVGLQVSRYQVRTSPILLLNLAQCRKHKLG